MNKKGKIIMIFILAIIFVTMAINFHKIKFAISILRLYNQEKVVESSADKDKASEIPMDNPFKEILSSANKVSNDDGNGRVNEVEPYITENEEIKAKDTNTNTNKKPHIKTTKRPYADIVIEFNRSFESLQSKYNGELDALVKQGINEYSRGEISNNKLASKYMALGGDLEKICDSKFNKLLKEMEAELKSNNHSTSITNDIKKYYNSFKDSRKTDLINRGKKYLD